VWYTSKSRSIPQNRGEYFKIEGYNSKSRGIPQNFGYKIFS